MREEIASSEPNLEIIRCPECAEDVRAAARRCKHCGARLVDMPPEKTLRVLHPSWWDSWVLLLFSFLVIPLIIAYVRTFSLTYTVTTLRVIVRKGLLSRSICEIDIKDIRSITVEQSLAQRIGGVGNLLIATAGTAGVEASLVNVTRPHEVKDLIIRQKRLLAED